jgi:hypothetical protein
MVAPCFRFVLGATLRGAAEGSREGGSLTHEAGEAAKGFIDALKDQPLSLALVVMNLLLLGFLYYTGVAAHDERKQEMSLLYENRKFVGEILAKCYPAPPEKY